MKMHCHRCGRMLRLWETKCPYCYRSALSWPHVIAVAAFVGAAIYWLKFS
ncbi:MAG TPA: hypothetical protein VJ715_12065 [Pyrinomonadaceae bacterium]|nr:hypothetical protein [Pyrinomonadaceae bacterium]